MPLLRTRNLRLSFGGPTLLDSIDLSIEAGERVCLVGRNGCGKSTLLKVLEGRINRDEGDIERRQGLKIAALDQQLPGNFPASVFDYVAEGLGKLGKLIRQFHHLSSKLSRHQDSKLLEQLEATQHELEAQGGWTLERRVETVISKLSLDPDARFDSLSGGIQRRVLLARALVSSPDLLLLDEPTNHLDIQAIEWLETFLVNFDGTLLFISHDRSFLASLATRIIDLDRGVLTDCRNEGRVRALRKMREERRNRRLVSGKAKMHTQNSASSGKLVVETIDAAYSFADRPLIRNLNTTILRGDKVGIIGPNGVGKTTLLRLLLGELQPQQGTIRLGTKLEIAYFDQRRAQLDEQRSVIDNLADGRQFIPVNNQQRHVISYLQDFLFAPDRCRTPVSALSGGERNRLLLAKLFSKPANLFVLDEPTNDLDIDTLDLLEELLAEYAGTVLLVSHDRMFLDRVVTSTLVFEDNAIVNEYVGGYSDWLQQRKPCVPEKLQTTNKQGSTTNRPKPRSAKLSYKDQRELGQLPQRIEQLETDIDALHKSMSDPDFYRLPSDEIAIKKERLSTAEADLQTAYSRWEELEQRKPAE
jgi:ATP-binding cassette subfamily F protein uup